MRRPTTHCRCIQLLTQVSRDSVYRSLAIRPNRRNTLPLSPAKQSQRAEAGDEQGSATGSGTGDDDYPGHTN